MREEFEPYARFFNDDDFPRDDEGHDGDSVFAKARERANRSFQEGEFPYEFKVWFNRPKRGIDDARERLYYEIKKAHKEVLVASAWFTDTDMVDAINFSKARTKIVVLSRADTKRPGSAKAMKALTCRPIVLGSGDFQEGIMHHKFVVIDREVVWTGSFNYTYQARKNYETLMRFNCRHYAGHFAHEVKALIDEEALWSGSTQCAAANNAFRCGTCEKLCEFDDDAVDNGSWKECGRCVARKRR